MRLTIDDIKSIINNYFSGSLPETVKYNDSSVDIFLSNQVNDNGAAITKLEFIPSTETSNAQCVYYGSGYRKLNSDALPMPINITVTLQRFCPLTTTAVSNADIWRAIEKLASAVEILRR
jgi:hypothetical protein